MCQQHGCFAWNLNILNSPMVFHTSVWTSIFPWGVEVACVQSRKVVGAAKPILFLVKKLVLESGQCQRVLWAAYCLPTFRWQVKSIPITSGSLGEVQLCYIIYVKLLAQKWGSGDCLQTHLEPAEHVTQVPSTLFDNINVWTLNQNFVA